MITPALRVSNLGVSLPDRPLVSGIDLDVPAGGSLAIVGESGSGKSLTARAILGLLPRGLSRQGIIEIGGRQIDTAADHAALRGSTVSLVMQDPFTMLNPLRTVGRQIADGLRGPARDDIEAQVARRLDEVGLAADVAKRHPFELSGGMRQRVGIAAALAADPDLLLADEPTASLDVTTQHEVLQLIRSLQDQRGMAFVMITHDLRVAFAMSDEIAVLYAGQLLETGPAETLRRRQRHPYTRALLQAEPSVERRVERLPVVAGRVPAHVDTMHQCPFADRCVWSAPKCVAGRPQLYPAGPAQLSACVRLDEISTELETALVAETAVESTGPSAAPAIVRISALTKQYAAGRPLALGGVDVLVRAGESVGVVGESGSGKTTLARCLVGLETPTSGTVDVDGIDCTDYRRLGRADLARARSTVQMVFQDPYSTLNPARRIGATLAEALSVAGRPSGSTDVAELLDLVGLSSTVAQRRPAGLSGGERQRISIARAVARRPRVLVCDESVSALDVTVQAQVIDLLGDLRRELDMGLLFITHDLAVLRQVTDRVYVLRDGLCVEEGATADVLDSPRHEYTRALLASAPRDDGLWL